MVLRMQTRKSAPEWGELVSAWETSGLTADVFASEHGVAGSTLRPFGSSHAPAVTAPAVAAQIASQRALIAPLLSR